MKIGIEGQRLFRKKKHGMDFVGLELVLNLMKIDKENEYVVFVKPGPDKCLQSSGNFLIVELEGGSFPQWEQIALPRAAKKHNCDLLHCTSNTGPIFCSVPLVLTLHDIFFLENISLFSPGFTTYQKFGNMYRRYVVPAVVKHAKKIMTVSLSEKRRIANFFNMHDDRLTVVYNGVSTRFTTITDGNELARIRETYKLPDNYFFLLGNTDPKKNTRGVIKAFAKFLNTYKDPMHLVLADFSEANLNEILTGEGIQHIRQNILRLDYIYNPDLPAIFSMCSLFLYPSFWESFGIPILEAMACGAPVITSNVFAMPEIAGDAAYQINPKNPDEITEAMTRIATDKELAGELRLKGKIQSTRFSWRKMAADYLEIYNEVYKAEK